MLPRAAPHIRATDASALPKAFLIPSKLNASSSPPPEYHKPKNETTTRVSIGAKALDTLKVTFSSTLKVSISVAAIGFALSAKTLPVNLARFSAAYMGP